MRAYELNEDFGVPTPSVEEVAGMHNLPVEQIQAEVDKGAKAEMEHTLDIDMAREIALDHLVEMPDYYTRLAKMEKGINEDKKMMPDQRSTYDQVVALHQTANQLGLYDAADWVKMHLDKWG